MIRKLLAAVPGQRLIQLIRYRLRLLDQRGNNSLGILVGDLRQCHVTRSVLRPGQQIAFPMTRNRSIFNCCRSLADQFGDLERCALRAGNVYSADGWDDVLKPVVARYQDKVSRIYFRADAAFAMPEVYEFLEAEQIKYLIRLPANQVLQS